MQAGSIFSMYNLLHRWRIVIRLGAPVQNPFHSVQMTKSELPSNRMLGFVYLGKILEHRYSFVSPLSFSTCNTRHPITTCNFVTMLPNANESDGQPSGASQRLASKLFSAMKEFGNLSEERVPSAGNEADLAFPFGSGATGLAATQTLHSAAQATNRKDVIAAKAHAEHEEIQHKLGILMEDPQLWLQFKARLHSSTSGSGTVGIQAALKEFVTDHPEIQAQFLREQNEANVLKSTFGLPRRMSILQAVGSLTAELSQEASTTRSSFSSVGSNVVSPALHAELNASQRRGSDGSHGSLSSAELLGKGHSNFMSSATELGLSFLKRASTVAGASMTESKNSAVDTIWVDEDSAEHNERLHALISTSVSPNGLVALTEQDEGAFGDEDGSLDDYEVINELSRARR